MFVFAQVRARGPELRHGGAVEYRRSHEGKKGRFEPAVFKGIECTALLMFMYNRISRDKCVHLISELYKNDRAEVEPRVDHVLASLKDKNLLLTIKYPNPSRNYGMNKFRIEE